MSVLSQEIWLKLSNDCPRGESLRARLAAPATTDRLLAALDSNEKRHLLISLESGDQHLNDLQSRGLKVETRELSMPEHENGWYIDIICQDSSGHEAFQIIGGELADRLCEQSNASESVTRILSKWRRFWGQYPLNLLSKNEQLGLFAELWFLNFWLIPFRGVKDAVSRWRGPFGARHDFEWPKRSVEVKATTSVRGPIHQINGIDQLVPPELGDLFLFSLRLREERGASNNLPSLIMACQQQLIAEDEALSQFEMCLHRAGYSSIHDEEYAKMKLRIIEEELYTVQDDFPRLTPAQFPQGIPPGIEGINYEINLNGFDRLTVSRKSWDTDASKVDQSDNCQ